MERYCKDCQVKLSIPNNWSETRKRIYSYICNPCNSKRQIKRIRAKEDGYHRVYLLPESNWIGTTYNCYQRMHWHKAKKNLTDTKNYRVLHKSKSRDECLELEKLLHDIGYKGRHAHNSYK